MEILDQNCYFVDVTYVPDFLYLSKQTDPHIVGSCKVAECESSELNNLFSIDVNCGHNIWKLL